MLYLLPIISIFSGLILAFYTKAELKRGRKFLVALEMILLVYFISFLSYKANLFSILNFLALAIPIIPGLLIPLSIFPGKLTKRKAMGILMQELPKGLLVFFYQKPNFLFPLLIYSIVEGSLIFKGDLRESLTFTVLSQIFYLTGVLLGTLFWNQALIFLSIGFFLVVLARSLYPRFVKGFEKDIEKLLGIF